MITFLLLPVILGLSINGIQRPLDFSFKDRRFIQLQTSVSRFYSTESNPKGDPTIIDLYSMLHVADLQYYKSIENLMNKYDLVLFELITSSKNIKVSDQYKRILIGDITSPKAEAIAAQLGLGTQLSNLYSVNRLKAGWFIADLDSETIADLERKNRESITLKYYLSRLFGRTFSEQLLKKFYLSDKVVKSSPVARKCYKCHEVRCSSPYCDSRVG